MILVLLNPIIMVMSASKHLLVFIYGFLNLFYINQESKDISGKLWIIQVAYILLNPSLVNYQFILLSAITFQIIFILFPLALRNIFLPLFDYQWIYSRHLMLNHTLIIKLFFVILERMSYLLNILLKIKGRSFFR